MIGVISALAACVTSTVAHDVHGFRGRNSINGICPRGGDLAGDVEGELIGNLSDAAKVYLPGSDEFDTASTRWSVLEAPKVNVVVVPGTADDVAETVR